TFHTIDFPGAIKAQPSSINNRGQIVGAYSQDGVGWHGFLLDNGTFTYLPGYSYGHQERGPDRWQWSWRSRLPARPRHLHHDRFSRHRHHNLAYGYQRPGTDRRFHYRFRGTLAKAKATTGSSSSSLVSRAGILAQSDAA